MFTRGEKICGEITTFLHEHFILSSYTVMQCNVKAKCMSESCKIDMFSIFNMRLVLP